MKRFYYVYKTTNVINGKQYIGDHATDIYDDKYLGSGKAIKAAVKKYGKQNFKREILEDFKSKEDAFKAQEKYITDHKTRVPNGYNIHQKGGYTDHEPLTIFESEEKMAKYLESIKDVRCGQANLITLHIPFKKS